MVSSSDNERRVAVTGIGIASPAGMSAAEFWTAVRDGHSGIATVDLFDGLALLGGIGGQVRAFTDESAKREYLKPLRKNLKVMCREIQLGVAAALLSLDHARLSLDQIDHERLGVDFGANLMLSSPETLSDGCYEACDEAGRFHMEGWGPAGIKKMEPLWLLRYLPNMPACHISIALDARGPSNSLTLDEASGNLTIAEARRIVRRGQADVMIAGTTGTRLHPVKSIHARQWEQLASRDVPPAEACRPFDRDRTGQVMAEGAASFVLEEEGSAVARGATIFGYIAGVGGSCVVQRDGTPQPRQALVNAMKMALKQAGLTPAQIGSINANGLGTIEDDILEAQAIHEVFGEFGSRVPVTAIKSVIGNPGASAGSLELAASVLGLKEGLIPPTLNYHHPDERCRLNVVHGEPLATKNPYVMKLSVTRMAQASVVIFRGA